MKLAVFDLDHTLVAMDTNEAWLRWLAANSGLRVEPFYADMVRFGREYDDGRLDIDEFMAYQLGILAKFRRPFLDKVLASFVKDWMAACLPVRSVELVKRHRDAGDVLVLCTATYSYVSSPVGALFGIENNLACVAETDAAGHFTGRLVDGTSYGPAKVERLKAFLATPAARGLTAKDVVFYSDSAVDLPMFRFTEAQGGTCVAVNASPDLAREAKKQGWLEITNYDKAEERKALFPEAGLKLFPEIFHHV